MIFIVVKMPIRPELADQWLSRVDEFTQATRAEPGNIFFEWSRSVDDPNTFVLVEAFQDGSAGDHVNSEHFKTFVGWAPDYVSATPDIISLSDVPGEGWSKMGEISPRQ
jgi:quinol monooxygenase YgiN